MSRGLNDFNVFETRFAQAVSDKFSRAPDIGSMLGQGTDAGNAKESFQLVKKAVLMSFDECVGGLGHNLL
jgi:hypothetical protein